MVVDVRLDPGWQRGRSHRARVKSAGIVIAVALLVVACASGSASAPSPKPAGALVVFTTWVADAKVTSGPEPGYRPALTKLTGDDIQSATAAIDQQDVQGVGNG